MFSFRKKEMFVTKNDYKIIQESQFYIIKLKMYMLNVKTVDLKTYNKLPIYYLLINRSILFHTQNR